MNNIVQYRTHFLNDIKLYDLVKVESQKRMFVTYMQIVYWGQVSPRKAIEKIVAWSH